MTTVAGVFIMSMVCVTMVSVVIKLTDKKKPDLQIMRREQCEQKGGTYGETIEGYYHKLEFCLYPRGAM